MIILDPDKPLAIPPEVAVCPYCDTKLTAQFDGWVQEDDGTWIADSMMLECETEPDVYDDAYDDWLVTHTDMPYVYMLPVEERIKEWVNEHYRFDLDHVANSASATVPMLNDLAGQSTLEMMSDVQPR